jgi:hypothetical protein
MFPPPWISRGLRSHQASRLKLCVEEFTSRGYQAPIPEAGNSTPHALIFGGTVFKVQVPVATALNSRLRRPKFPFKP